MDFIECTCPIQVLKNQLNDTHGFRLNLAVLLF